MYREVKPDPGPDPLYDPTLLIHEGPAHQDVVDAVMKELSVYLNMFISSKRLREQWMEEVRRGMDHCQHARLHLKALNYQIISQTITELMNSTANVAPNVLAQAKKLRLHFIWKEMKKATQSVGRNNHSSSKNLSSVNNTGNYRKGQGKDSKKTNPKPFTPLKPQRCCQQVLKQQIAGLRNGLNAIDRHIRLCNQKDEKNSMQPNRNLRYQINKQTKQQIKKPKNVVKDNQSNIRKIEQTDRLPQPFEKLSYQPYFTEYQCPKKKHENDLQREKLNEILSEAQQAKTQNQEIIKALSQDLSIYSFRCNQLVQHNQALITERKLQDNKIEYLEKQHESRIKLMQNHFDEENSKRINQKASTERRHHQQLEETRKKVDIATKQTAEVRQLLRITKQHLQLEKKNFHLLGYSSQHKKRDIEIRDHMKLDFQNQISDMMRKIESKDQLLKKQSQQSKEAAKVLSEKLSEIDSLEVMLEKMRIDERRDKEIHEMALQMEKRVSKGLREEIDSLKMNYYPRRQISQSNVLLEIVARK